MRKLTLILLLLAMVAPAFAKTAKSKVRRGIPLSFRPMFPPSSDSLLRQNAEIERLGLQRIQDSDELDDLVKRGELVPLPLGPALRVDPRLPANRRYCRPWTAKFLTDLSNEFYAQFQKPLQVNSAVRTVDFQKKLRRYNRNAAPFEGEKASSHLAGLTVDLARKGLTKPQVRFLQSQLLILKAKGLVEVEEEFHQLCFHIMVSGHYGDPNLIPTVDAKISEDLIGQ